LAPFNGRGGLGFIIFVCNLMTETEATAGTFCVLTKKRDDERGHISFQKLNVQKPLDFL